MKYIISSALLLAVPALSAPTTTSSFFERQASCAAIPSGYTYKTDAKLPDPFTTVAGTKVTTLAEWACRKQEIKQLMDKYELGTFPPKPASVTGTVSSSSISVSVTEGGKSISFSAKVTLPSTGSAPYPMLITIGGSSLPALPGVGTIAFGNDEMAQQQGSSSRGKGKFYDLYGSGHTAGATTAWAWGVARIIDVIEANPDSKIDTKRLAVTGCSRNGKGAFITGALEERIALTIPQESGSGGAACWRISDSENAAGKKIQTAGELVGEDPWFSKNLDTYAKRTSDMAVDHHFLAAMIAPRALLVIDNSINWLGPVSITGCQRAGAQIYKALGVSANMGLSVTPEHSHCQFPSSQQPELTAFVNKFLKGGSDNTAGVDKSPNTDVTASTYASWTAPILT